MEIPKRRANWTKSRWKKELDSIYSKYIRQKYARNGQVKCYTCPNRNEIKKMQCGHFVPRQYLRTRFDERNTKPQCYACNMLYGGQPSKFATELKKEYGEGIIEELEKNRLEPVLLDINWYVEQIAEYEKKLKKL